MPSGLNTRLWAKLPWISSTLMGSDIGLVNVHQFKSGCIPMRQIIQILTVLKLLRRDSACQETQTTKKVQAKPPKYGAMGANGPWIWASAKPIQGKPVRMVPRRYSMTAQLAASNSPESGAFLKSGIARLAQEKKMAIPPESKKTATQESRGFIPPTSWRLM